MRHASTAPANHVSWLPAAAILILALALRIAYAFNTVEASGFDEGDYTNIAGNLLAGRGWIHSGGAYSTALPGQPTSFFEPLYPAFLAGIFALVGTDHLRWARMLQALLTTGSVALLMRVSRQVWDARVALVIGLVAAVYLPFVFFSGLLMTENLFIFLLLLFLAAWTTAVGTTHPAHFVAAGVCFGAACLTRSALALFLPIICVLTAYALRPMSRRSLTAVALLITGAVLTIGPWTARNYSVHHAIVPLTTKGGFNLYFYTYPAANLDFNERHTDVPRPEMHGLTEVERDRRFYEGALSNISSTPALQLRFAAAKLFDFINPMAKRGPWVLRCAHAALFFFILALALRGAAYARPRAPMTVHLLWSLVAYYTVLAAIFTGGGKARLQIEPALLLLAGGGLASLRSVSPAAPAEMR